MTGPEMPDRPLLGIALMAGFCLLVPLGDGLSKLAGASVPILTIVAARFFAQGLLLAPSLRAGVPRKLLPRIAIRAGLHMGAMALLFVSLRYLPLADAIAIAFVTPLLVLLFGRVFAGEEVGPTRLLACVLGFGGTLLVLQPNLASAGPVALLPLGVALGFAVFMLMTRTLTREMDAVPLQAVSGLMASAVLLPAVLLTGPSSLSGQDLALLAVIGVLGTLAHLLMTLSLRYAPSATLAPIQYLEIPIAVAVGAVLFGDLPGPLASLGILVTIGAGLLALHSESRIAARSRRTDLRPPPL